MYERLMFETNFRLRRVDIDINIFVRNRHKHDHDRKCTGGQDVPISFANRMQDDSVPYQPSINEEEHRIAVVFLDVRPRRKYVNLYTRAAKAFFVLDKLIKQISPEHLKDSFAVTRRCRRRQNFETTTLQIKVNFRKGQSIVRTVGRNLAELVRFGPEKFPARRNVEEQIFHRDLRALWKRLLTLR